MIFKKKIYAKLININNLDFNIYKFLIKNDLEYNNNKNKIIYAYINLSNIIIINKRE